jgi:hypothetical protein
MAFLTVPELAEKFRTSEYSMVVAVAGWIKSGDLVEPTHFSRRRRAGVPYHPREFNERAIAMLIIRDRDKQNCIGAFVNGYSELLKTLKG